MPLPQVLCALLSLAAPQQPDVYVFVIDDVSDVSIDEVRAAYSRQPLPNIAKLQTRGVRFSRAYAHPKCQPSRHTLNTGEWEGLYHGLEDGDCYAGPDPAGWDTGDFSLARMMQHAGYETALFGKAHFGRPKLEYGPETVPHALGYERWLAGSVGNLRECDGTGYNGWWRWDDGLKGYEGLYETQALIDAFDDWVQETPGPRFGVVSFAACHKPFSELPPSNLLPKWYVPPITPTQRDIFEAMLMSVDKAIGRMLSQVEPGAIVIVIGDNGVAPAARSANQVSTKVKGSLYEGGVRVPFIVSGPLPVQGVRTDALAHIADIVPTLAQGLGIRLHHPLDGRSLLPVLQDPHGDHFRDYVYVQNIGGIQNNARRAVVTDQWKLMDDNGVELLFDLLNDPEETNPLDANANPVTPQLRAWLNAP